jgi:hypothetical protein
MDVLAALLTCSLHADDALVRAIVDNAHDNPLSILTPELDPETGAVASAPQTLDEATRRLQAITAHGGRPLVGLMQVPTDWASDFGREATDLFDPCINVAIGTAMLSEFDSACAKAAGTPAPKASLVAALTTRRRCSVQRYARAIQMPDLATVATLELRYRRSAAAPPNDAPIFPLPPERRWGSDCVFVAATSLEQQGSFHHGVDPIVPAEGTPNRELTPIRSRPSAPSRTEP